MKKRFSCRTCETSASLMVLYKTVSVVLMSQMWIIVPICQHVISSTHLLIKICMNTNKHYLPAIIWLQVRCFYKTCTLMLNFLINDVRVLHNMPSLHVLTLTLKKRVADADITCTNQPSLLSSPERSTRRYGKQRRLRWWEGKRPPINNINTFTGCCIK